MDFLVLKLQATLCGDRVCLVDHNHNGGSHRVGIKIKLLLKKTNLDSITHTPEQTGQGSIKLEYFGNLK